MDKCFFSTSPVNCLYPGPTLSLKSGVKGPQGDQKDSEAGGGALMSISICQETTVFSTILRASDGLSPGILRMPKDYYDFPLTESYVTCLRHTRVVGGGAPNAGSRKETGRRGGDSFFGMKKTESRKMLVPRFSPSSSCRLLPPPSYLSHPEPGAPCLPLWQAQLQFPWLIFQHSVAKWVNSIQRGKREGSCALALNPKSILLANFPWIKSQTQSCLTLCNPMDYNPPVSSVHRILEARIPEWVAISFSRGPSQPTDWTRVSCISGGVFTIWATKETFHE